MSKFSFLFFVLIGMMACKNHTVKKTTLWCENLCKHGICMAEGDGARCVCDEAYDGLICDTCAEGYELNGNDVCEPTVINPCNPNPCVNGFCVLDGGSYIHCLCNEGYEGLLCETCAEGYELNGNGVCEPIVINPCDPNPCTSGICVPDEDTFLCECTEGYTGEFCTDCAVGFVKLNNGTCVIDDCQNQTCANHGTCSMNLDTGLAFCNCDSGYEAVGLLCVDINECLSNPCLGHSTCTNLDGSYECACQIGYTGLACDECANGFVEVAGECVANICDPNPCQNGGTCSINGGLATCSCTTGYTGDYCQNCSVGFIRLNNGTCVLDTCAGQTCSGHGTCSVDLYTGNASCACEPGFEASGLACTDINECLSNPCDVNATCTNMVESFTCTCNSGYTGDGFVCSNVNECLNNPCDVNATCTDTVGSYICTCNVGFTGDGVTCSDVNECVTGANNCHENATCTNTAGSFTCTCNAGYEGDGVTCTDINECLLSPCPANAICVNLPGSYNCICQTGYTGSNCDQCDTANGYSWDGTDCALNPCFGVTCNGHGTCSVVAGNPVCSCETGYTGDTCADCSSNYRLMGAFCQPMFGRLSGGSIYNFVEVGGDLYGFGQNEVVVKYDEVEDNWVEVWRPDIAWHSNDAAEGIRNDFMVAASDGQTVYLLQHYFAMEEWTFITGSNRNIVRTFSPGAPNPWGQLADIPPTGTQIKPVHCNDLGVTASADMLWAVCDDGTVYKYNWTTNSWYGELLHDNNTSKLNKIWVENSNSIFVVGAAGFIKHWNGLVWEDWRNATLNTDLYGIWGYSSSDLYVGGQDKLWHWNGTSWSLKFNQSNLYRYVRKIHGTADHSRIVALAIHDWNDGIGYNSHIWQSVSGGAWTGAADIYYWSVYCDGVGVSGDECFLGGSAGTIDKQTRLVRLTGAVQEQMIYLSYVPNGVSGHDQNDLLFVGFNEAVHFNGSRYTFLPVAAVGESGNMRFMATWANGLGGYWLVGPKGYVLYWDGSSYGVGSLSKHLIDNSDYVLDIDMVLAVHGSSPINVWAVGHKGATFRWDGSSWTRFNLPHADNRVTGILAVSATEVYAVGRNWSVSGPPYVYKWDGNVWSVVYTHTKNDYYTYNLIKDGVHICTPFSGGSRADVVCSEGGDSWSTFITTSSGNSSGKMWGTKDNLFFLANAGLVLNYRAGVETRIHRETSNTDDDDGAGRLIDVWQDPNSDFTVIIGVSSKVLIHR